MPETMPGPWSPRAAGQRGALSTPTNLASATLLYLPVLKGAGLDPKEWVPRETRHTFVSVMSDNGASDEVIVDLVGHAKTSTTRTVYRHQLRPVITTGADIIEKAFEEE